MIKFIIFSKDRACQLELLLRSFKEYINEWKEFSISILYTYSSEEFQKGYEKVRLIHPEFDHVLEKRSKKRKLDKYINKLFNIPSNFKRQVIDLVEDSSFEYIAFLVDDIFFKNSFTLNSKEFEIFKSDKDILALSLRMSPQINYSYSHSKNIKVPNLDKDNIWRWKGEEADWGYPMSVDGHIFRKAEILPLIKKLNFKNPNTFESVMAAHPLQNPKMICFSESILVNNPANKVQDEWNNRSGNISAEEINKEFISGKKIDYDHLKGVKNNSPHVEYEIKWGNS